ncbi:unnamed protein product [Ectocarpus sp. 13 AM-2016]
MSWMDLHQAAAQGMVKRTSTLLSRPLANVDQRDNDGFTPLIVAAQEGHHNVVRVLLEHGAQISMASYAGCTALIMTAIHGQPAVATALLDAGADVNTSDINGCTALYCAANHGHLSVAKILLENGAQPSLGTSTSSKSLFVQIPTLRTSWFALLELKASSLSTWRRKMDTRRRRIPKGRANAPGRRGRCDFHLQLAWRDFQVAPLPMREQHPQQVLSRPTRYRGATEQAGGHPPLVVASGGNLCVLLALVQQHSLHSACCRGGGRSL